jgi:bifunctional DNA-binding transcriptional regulator/antitoxin component of YhaV-PrlF toxin-antitoxin module
MRVLVPHSKAFLGKNTASSLRATIPREIANAAEIEAGDTILWFVRKSENGDEIVVLASARHCIKLTKNASENKQYQYAFQYILRS